MLAKLGFMVGALESTRGMDQGLLMATRWDTTKKYPRQHAGASKKDKSVMLDDMVG